MNNIIKLPNSVKTLYFIGDLHSSLELVKYHVNYNHITNSAIFLCGDVGIGWNKKWEAHIINLINKKLIEKSVWVFGCRGNHEDPMCFNDISLVKDDGSPRNWLNLPDYSIVNVNNKNILICGGGISIDRTWRIKEGIGYWSDEQVKYQPKVDEKIDIICSHSAPSFAPPTFKGDFVMQWAAQDPDLLKDIDIERKTLDKVYDDYKDTVTHWYYGHFHQSTQMKYENTYFRCCNIGELVPHLDANYYYNLDD